MSTDLHPELGDKNPYHISKEKYYELKHFCRQYPEWQKAYNTFTQKTIATYSDERQVKNNTRSTENIAELLLYFKEKMDLVDSTLNETDPTIAEYLKVGIIDGYSYEFLRTAMNIPIGRDGYYSRYRKFFFLLAQKR